VNSPAVLLLISGASLPIPAVFLAVFFSRVVRVPPNRALIVSGMGPRDGRGGVRIVKGGRTFVWPVFERADPLSLEDLGIEFRYDVRAADGGPMRLDGVAQVKVRGDQKSILAAAESFLSKTPDQVKEVVAQILENPSRACAAEAASAAEVRARPEALAGAIAKAAEAALQARGLEIVSLVMRA
jgi:flotillin